MRYIFKKIGPVLCHLTARLRFLVLLKLTKAIPIRKARVGLIALFDPNYIRKQVNYSFNKKLVRIPMMGHSFQIDINDHVGYRFFIEDGFDKTVEDIADLFGISESDIFLDISANIGTTSIPVALKTKCEVIAVEASKSNAAILLENAFLNSVKLKPLIYCVVDDKTHSTNPWIEFTINNGNTGASSIYSQWNPSLAKRQVEYVKSSTLDSLLSDSELSRIKLIKIDVEGAEEIVLRGAQNLVRTKAPILFEYRVDATDKYLQDDGSALVDWFKKDFNLYGINPGGDFEPFSADRAYENALALPKSRVEEFEKVLSIQDAH